MNPMNRQLFYRGLRGKLRAAVGRKAAGDLWREAGREYAGMLRADPSLRRHRGAMVLPAVALYRVMLRRGLDAEALLSAHGGDMGRRFAKVVHGVTLLPGVPQFIWRHVEGIMDRMSSEKLGYRRRIVSRPPEMFGVDILSCPYHELARALGAGRAVLCICHMDREYMKGFHHIRYERTTAVSEGAECCDYRLRFDRSKR